MMAIQLNFFTIHQHLVEESNRITPYSFYEGLR